MTDYGLEAQGKQNSELSGINLAVQKKTLTSHPLEPAKPLNDAQMAGRFFLR